MQITLKLHLKLCAKTKVVIGVVLDGQLRRIAKRIGIRNIAKKHAKYVLNWLFFFGKILPR